MNRDLPPAQPSDAEPSDLEPTDLDPVTTEPEDASDLDYDDLPDDGVPCTDDDVDDAQWEAFIPDEDERDPWPDPDDFWLESSQGRETDRQGDKEKLLLARRLFVFPTSCRRV